MPPRPGRPGPLGPLAAALLGALADVRPRDLLRGLAVAAVLAVPDFARQLPVRDDPSRLHALVVDVLGVASAAVAQVVLIGMLAGLPWLSGGTTLLLRAVRRRPGAVLAGLVVAGAGSALLTLLPSVLLLGYAQVLGPLRSPPLRDLVLAQLSDVVATAVTAPYFAVLVRRCAGPDSTSARPR